MDLDSSVVERSYVKREAQGSMPGSVYTFLLYVIVTVKDWYGHQISNSLQKNSKSKTNGPL